MRPVLVNRGDLVLRGPRPTDPEVGTVTSTDWDRQSRQHATVLWSWSQYHSRVRSDRLLPATPENVTAAREHVKPTRITPALQRTLDEWRRRVGDELSYPNQVFAERSNQATAHRHNCRRLILLGDLVPDRTDVGTASRRYRPAVSAGENEV